MKKTLFCLLLVLRLQATIAQERIAAEVLTARIQDQDVVSGQILKEGKKIDGYIRRLGTTYDAYLKSQVIAPWEFQNKIEFIEKNRFETLQKVRNKDYETYDAKDIEEYTYDTLVFKSVKFADATAVGTNMIPRKMFLRQIKQDKISVFHFHEEPPIVGETSEMSNAYKQGAFPHPVYQKGPGGKPRMMAAMNIDKEMQDCPVVIERYNSGKYNEVGKENDKNDNKFLNKTLFHAEVVQKAINDYNLNCK
jgi:hypothetical protein